MADVGLDASLELDIAGALRQVDALERRLNEATTLVLRADASLITGAIEAAIAAAADEVRVQADASDVTGSLDAAIDAADDRVDVTADVTADARDVTGDITAAVDAADSTVTVDGEAPGVTGAIDAAVDQADTSVTIDADASSLRGASGLADDLAGGLAEASASGAGLSSVLRGLGAAGAAAGLYSLVTAASDLEQAVGGTTAIFGESQTAVVGFARGAAEAAGLTEESARSLTSQLGGLLQGFGFTQDQAAELSITLAQLGADLAATFGGSTVEAVQAIGAALRGETDPIERYGISLNAAAIEARALETGLASNKDELTANAKAQSALAIITEQAANAQGQFGREADTTAGQLERAKAEAGNMAAAVGAELQPAMNELLSLARSEFIPALGDLGESLGPALADVILALVPAFGSFTSLLSAVTPAVSALAGALDLIPDPVIAALGTLLALRRVAGPVGEGLSAIQKSVSASIGPFNQARAAGQGFGSSLGSLATSVITPANIALAGLTIVLTGYAAEQERARQRQQEFTERQKAFTSALSESTSSVRGITDALTAMIEAGDEMPILSEGIASLVEIPVADVFTLAGVSVDRFAEAVAAGGHELDALLRSVDNGTARAALEDLAENLQQAGRQSIIAGIALGDFTQAQADAAIESTRNVDGSKNYAAALDELEASAKRSAEQQDRLAEAVGGVDSEGAAHQVTELGLRLGDLRGPLEGLDGRFTAFALAADAAGLSGADLEAVAQELGTNADQLGPAIDRVVGPINDMADAAAGAAPDLAELAGPIEEFSAQGFRDELQKSYESLVNFRDNLTILSEFSPRLAAAAAELGPQYTQTLADALRDGQTDVLNEASLLLAGIEQEQQGLVDDTRNVHGPALVEEMGLTAQGMSEAFGRELDLVTPTGQSIRSIEGTVEEQKGAFLTAVDKVATDATAGFAGNFTPDPRQGLVNADAQVQERQPSWLMRLAIFGNAGNQGFSSGFRPSAVAGLVNVAAQVAARQGGFFSQLNIFGSRGTAGFGAGIGGMDDTAAGAADSAVGAVRGRGGSAYSGGYSLGVSIGQGFTAGVGAVIDDAVSAAVGLMDAALAAAKARGGISSPSKVWRDEIGKELVAGVVDALGSGEAEVERASVSFIDSALAAAQASVDSVAPIAFDPAVTASLSGAGVGGTVVQVAAGAVVINVPAGSTPQQAQALGSAAGKGFLGAVAKRRVAATARMSGAR